MGLRAALTVLALALGCSEPAPAPTPPVTAATQEDGLRVTVGGREVVVHCALTCPATETEMSRLSADCLSNPSSGPHRVAPGGALLTLGCCSEASLAYERACGHEGIAGCAQEWTARCQGMQPLVPAVPEDDRGVAPSRGAGR